MAPNANTTAADESTPPTTRQPAPPRNPPAPPRNPPDHHHHGQSKLHPTDRTPGKNPGADAWRAMTNHELAAAKRDRSQKPPPTKNRRQKEWARLRDLFESETKKLTVNGATLQEFDPTDGVGIRNAVIEPAKKLREPSTEQRQWIRFLLRQSAICIWLGEATDNFRLTAIARHVTSAEQWWGILHWKQQFSIWQISRAIARDEKLERRRRRIWKSDRREICRESVRVGIPVKTP